MNVEPAEQVDIVVGCTEEERIVDVALCRRQCAFLFESLERSGLRHGVRHVEIRRNTAIGRSTALRTYVGLCRKARLTKMHMVVDNARKHIASRGINHLIKMFTARNKIVLENV